MFSIKSQEMNKPSKQTNKRTNEQMNERTNKQTNKQNIVSGKNRQWWPTSLRRHAISQLTVATEGPGFDIYVTSFVSHVT